MTNETDPVGNKYFDPLLDMANELRPGSDIRLTKQAVSLRWIKKTRFTAGGGAEVSFAPDEWCDYVRDVPAEWAEFVADAIRNNAQVIVECPVGDLEFIPPQTAKTTLSGPTKGVKWMVSETDSRAVITDQLTDNHLIAFCGIGHPSDRTSFFCWASQKENEETPLKSPRPPSF